MEVRIICHDQPDGGLKTCTLVNVKVLPSFKYKETIFHSNVSPLKLLIEATTFSVVSVSFSNLVNLHFHLG